MYDYVVVGAGISGSIAARCFAEQGQKVLVVERRNHIAGNLYDETDESGILVQKYGPHIFHTNNPKVEEYLKKWGSWEDYFLECMVYMNGKYTPSPFNFQTIDDYFPKEKAEEIKSHIRQIYGNVPKETIVNMLECEDSVIREYAEFLYANDYSLYTAKQWGIEPSEIDKNVLRRVPVLFSYKTGYFDDTCQMMPTQGFTAVIKNILNHPNITVLLNTDANHSLSFSEETKKVYYEGNEITVIYTGAVDELLDYRYGRLPYRSLRFEWKSLEEDSYQQAPVVAYPQAEGYTRITEYKKLSVQKKEGKTVIAVEYPLQADEELECEPYYPIPTEETAKMYGQYREYLEDYKNLYLLGRLAEYKYYNMDQVIENALYFCENFKRQ